MIQKFTCHNYRNIHVDDLSLERLNLFIGPNNSGKSNFIRAISFLGSMLKEPGAGSNRSAFLNTVKRYGWEHMHNNETPDYEPIDFSWKFNLGGSNYEYNLSFAVGEDRKDNHIVFEELNSGDVDERYDEKYHFFSCHGQTAGEGYFSTSTKKGSKNHHMPFLLNDQDSLLSQFKDILLENKSIYAHDDVRVKIADLLSAMKHYFINMQLYASSYVNTLEMRQPGSTKMLEMNLARNAANFVNVYNAYAAENSFDNWEEEFRQHLQAMIHDLEDVRVVSQYDKLIMKLRFGGYPYTLEDVSEGTLKILVMNLLLHMPEKHRPSILVMDEPENNLHPAWNSVLAEWLVTTGNYEQCFVSTHSPELLDALTQPFLEHQVGVYVFSRHGDIKKIMPEQLQDELNDWELGDLYRVNDPALGGWPW